MHSNEDGKVDVDIELTSEEIATLALAAHNSDMTLNAYIVSVLEAFVDVNSDLLDDMAEMED